MEDRPEVVTALQEIETGIYFTKCQQCGCMGETLEQIGKSLPTLPEDITSQFRDRLPGWVEKMKAVRYSCLGCEHCYAGVAQNAFTNAFPETESQFGLSCEIQMSASEWPSVVGEYVVLDPTASVAVTTLASPNFTQQLADRNIPGLAIIGKLETENIGIDKLIKNMISNPNLHYLIVAGIEPTGHFSGQTLIALAQNGVDEKGRVIGSKGKRPILRNVTQAEIETFRKQIKVIDLIGCECNDCVSEKIAELRKLPVEATILPASCGCSDSSCGCSAIDTVNVPTTVVEETDQQVKLDKAGYFVVLPIPERKVINVEHYSYDNQLLHVIEGTSARSLYLKIIQENWISELSHAAYIGKELTKAELNLAYGIPYHQDAA